MTKEEAIHVINQVRDIITKDPSWMEEAARVVNEAANMAIKALEAQEVSNNSPELDKENGDLISGKRTEERTETHACDLISRQTAIDALCELMHHWFGGDPKDEIREIKRELEKLPSAQPEIVRCKDCKHWREGTVYSYCDRLYGMGVLDTYDYMVAEDDYCSMAERRTDDS